jgi:hypothetical protein
MADNLAVNGIEPRNCCFLLDSAQRFGCLEGNIGCCVMASGIRRPGVGGPFVLHNVPSK